MSKQHDTIIEQARSIISAANEPVRLKTIREKMAADWDGQYVAVTLHYETKRANPRLMRIAHGIYALPEWGLTPAPPKQKKSKPSPPAPESPKSYIEALCDVLRAYEPDLTDEQRKAVGEALETAVSLVVVPDPKPSPQPPPKGWLARLGLGND